MRCRSAEARLDAFRTGELPANQTSEVRAHLRTCDRCSTALEAIRRFAGIAPSLRHELQPAATYDSFTSIDDAGERVWVAFSTAGLRMLFRGVDAETFRREYARRHGRPLKEGVLPELLRHQVQRALAGSGVESPRVEWSERTTPFEREVLGLLSRIPRGEVRTYEWLARKAGRPRAVRAVGNILARNSVPIVVPCHRVVPTAGGVGNYIFGSGMKRDLLRKEGVDLDALDRLTRRGIRYVGSKTTNIACVPTCRDARRIREENQVLFRRGEEAARHGYRPCKHCEPFT